MQQLSYRGRGDLAVEDVEPLGPGPGEVRVRVHSTGVCMSDVYGYAGVNDRRDAVLEPGGVLVMGHESSGFVDALGAGVEDLAVGDAVAINPVVGCDACAHCAAGDVNLCEERHVYGCLPLAPGGFAELETVPRRALHALAPGTSLELGALVEPLTVGFHGVRLAAPGAGDRVVVVGGGIIGLGAALAARRCVGEHVLVVEPREERRALCAALGLEAVHPDALAGSERRFDVALDCVARPETFAAAVRALRPQGLVVLVGIWADEIPLPVSEVVWRETRIFGSYGYSPADFADVAAWVGRGEADLGLLVQRRVGFDGLIPAFAAYADGSLTAVRTLFQPHHREDA